MKNSGGSHWIVEHDILSRQFQQHRIVEEFVDADILAQTLKKTQEKINILLLGLYPSSKYTFRARPRAGGYDKILFLTTNYHTFLSRHVLRIW